MQQATRRDGFVPAFRSSVALLRPWLLVAGVAAALLCAPASAGADYVNGSFIGTDQHPVKSIVAADDYSCVLLAVTSDPVRCWGSVTSAGSPIGLDGRKWLRLATRSKTFCVSQAAPEPTGGEGMASPTAGDGAQAGAPTCWNAVGTFEPGGTDFSGRLGGPISLAADFGCAILGEDGVVGCWGSSVGFPDDNADATSQTTSQSEWNSTVALALGTHHGCAIENGRVHCWGSNTFGQTAVPARFTDGHRLVDSVSSGATHSCAVLQYDGSVACWGDNRRGEANPPDGLRGVTQVAAGGRDDGSDGWTCAIVRDGTVSCWGDNQFGQATPPSDLGRVRDLSAGAAHTCAITVSDAVRCWGSNASGQAGVPTNLVPPAPVAEDPPSISGEPAVGRQLSLDPGSWDTVADYRVDDITWQTSSDSTNWVDKVGSSLTTSVSKRDAGRSIRACVTVVDAFGSTANACSNPTQSVLPTPLNDFYAAHIAAGGFHSCALSRTGRVVCWGGTGGGPAGPPGGLSNLRGLAAGGDTTCALKPSGAAVCWASGSNGDQTSGFSDVTAIDPGFTRLKAIRVGPYAICGITSADAAVCKPTNGMFDGNFGPAQSNGGDRLDQGAADVPADLGPVKDLELGAYHACALKADGSVACWGRAVEGQLEVPDGLANVKALAAGGFHNCAVGSDDRPVCWGYNYDGQASVPDDLGAVRQMSLGLYHTCAVTMDRAVRCWGTDDQGQTEIGSQPNPVAEVAAGAGHTCVMTIRGQVSCWGNDRHSQAEVPLPLAQVTDAGIGANRTCVVTGSRTVRCFGNGGVSSPLPAADGYAVSVAVPVDGDGACAQKADRALVCSGIFDFDGTMAPTVRSYSIGNSYPCWITLDRTSSCDPRGPVDVSPAKAVVAGQFTTCWIKTDSTLVCSGNSRDGTASFGQADVPNGLGGVTSVAVGGGHTCAALTGGSIRCWGLNAFGQTDVPAGLAGATAVAAGRRHSCGLLGSGSVRCWGDDEYGQASPPSDLGAVTKLIAAGDRTCAITTAQALRCWGADMSDQSHDPGVAPIAPLPSVTALSSSDVSPSNLTSHSFQLTFSEPVVGLSSEDLVVTGTSSGWSVQSVSGSGAGPYTVTLTGSSATTGTLGVALLPNSIADQYGSAAPLARSESSSQIAIDRTPPAAPSVSGAPASPTNSRVAAIAFAGEVGATFTCSIDGGASGPCTSPLNLAGLAGGVHSVSVSQTDVAGNVGPTASASWTVDFDPPAAPSLTGIPVSPSRYANASLGFTGEDAARFECSVDQGAYSACSSPKAISGLGTGPHSFQVRQIDTAGNTGPASRADWTVDLVPPPAPGVLGLPLQPSNQTSASLTLTLEAGAVAECSLDGAAFAPCSSPVSILGLGERAHTFQAHQVDAAGNIGPNFNYTWTTDVTAPTLATRQLVAVNKGFAIKSTLSANSRDATWLEFSAKPVVSDSAAAIVANSRAYAALVPVPSAGVTWVRIGDLAGNRSAWVKLAPIHRRAAARKARSRRAAKRPAQLRGRTPHKLRRSAHR